MTRRSIIALSLLFTVFVSAPVFASFGRTPGQFAVSSTGAAQYSIPIWTPPGPRGIQPHLSLVYNSQSGIGPVGIGWALAGLGAITRCNLTYAQDTTSAPVALVTGDGYCLNGNRLRLTSGTYGVAGSTYQTEVADFSNVTANGAAGNGPAYFTVQGRDGLTYEYGYTDSNGNGANSQVLASGTSTADFWLLSKVIDRAGNNYVINYTILTGTAVPNTILWTPTSAGASTYAYTIQFNYTTNVPQSSPKKFIGGTPLSNTNLLSSIEIISSGTVVKDYFLGYQASPTTAREELISIKECADSAQSNCLLPTSVTYQNGAAGVTATPTSAISGTFAELTARYDLNGDGIPDLVYDGPSGWVVAFGSASGGYGTPVSIPAGVYLLGNLTGGSEDGILTVVSGTWWYYTWNGTSFTGASTGIAYDSTAYQYQLADINGDGLPDLISLYVTYIPTKRVSVATIDTRLNTSTGGTASFSATLTPAYTLRPIAAAQLETPDLQYGKLRRFDFNGDGRDDLALEVTTGTYPNYGISTYELISTGTGFTATVVSSVAASAYLPVFFTNWNDDACTDFVENGTLYISGCNGSLPATYSVGTVVGDMDWDGDGRTDLVVANGSTLGVYLSTGNGVSSLQSTSIPYSSNCAYVTMNGRGDGEDDIGCGNAAGLSYYAHNSPGQPPDLMSSIKDGYGNSVSPTYVSIAQSNYQEYTDATYPNQNYIGPLYVVSEAVFSDPSNLPSGTYNQQFTYYGAWTNLQGRGFEGFYATHILDSRNGLTDYQYYERAFPYTGMKFQDIVSNGTFYPSETTGTPALTTLDNTANNERYFPYFSSVTTTQREVGGAENGDLITTSATNYTYDNYGNATNVATTVTDNDPGSPYSGYQWTSTTANTITPDPGTWCLGLPSETQVTNSSTAPGGAAITRTVDYSPDYTNCRETQKVTEPNSATYKVTEGYTYDSFGNLWTDTVTGIGMAGRVTTITWGTTGQFPTTVSNPLGQSITLGFDPNSGKLTSRTDPNWTAGNPIETTWGYDAFQRKTLETRPDGTSTTWAYNNCATNGCVNSNNQMTVTQTIVNVGGSTQSVTNTYLDAVDRTLVTSRTMLSGAYDRNEVQYDSLGRVHQQGAPCVFGSCTNYWTTLTYDVLNRLTQSQRPISATNGNLQTTTYGYAGRTRTVTDALNNTTTKIYLVTGALARSQDAKGYYQNFSYDAFGSLLNVTDSLSNTLLTATYQYGIGAFKTAATDMDSGARSYTVDALGEVTAYSDAKGQNFSMTYDALSRSLVRTEPDLTTTWTWGNTAGSDNIGKLQSVSSAGSAGTYSESYTYDSKTRLSVKNITIPGDASYAYTYSYNATTGLLDTLQYPVSTSSYQLKLQYAYAHGILQSIADYNAPSTVFWTADATNPRGQITQETLGNGVVTNRAYDAVTSWISSIQSGVGGGAALQNSSFLFDEMGDVTQRQNNNLGLTENFYYDADYRLDHSAVGSTTVQMGYDAMGDITSRSDVAGGAAWTYDPVRKHAVTEAGSSGYLYSYDNNGNMTSRSGNTITWTSYNYPSGVNSPGESATFQYGPDRQRWKTIYTGSIGTETTYHVGGLLEKVISGGITDYRHYIFAGSESIAIYSRQSTGANVLHYVLGDHQGSFAAILTSSGTTDVNESFTPYGNRRSAATWSGAPSSGDETAINAVSRWGYTGQTVLGVSMGLNHLNGRVEDAVTGRFLSPDPYVPDPGNTQSFNRYSYVINNPLTRIDPSGFSPPCNGCVKPNNPLPPSGYSGDGSGDGSSGDLATVTVTAPRETNPTDPFAGSFTGNAGNPNSGSTNGGGSSAGNSNRGAAAGAAATAPDVLSDIVVTATRTASVAFATTGIFVLGVLFPSNTVFDDTTMSADQKPPGKSRQSKPINAPPGTRPIDQSGNSHDWIEGTKDAVGAGPADWVGVAPNGDIITTNPDGTAENHGPSTEPN